MSQTDLEAALPERLERREELESAADRSRQELEFAASTVTALVLRQPPAKLIGYIWSQVYLGVLQRQSAKKRKHSSKKNRDFEFYQFVLEYLHAVWSGNRGPFPEGDVDAEDAERLLIEFDVFKTKTMQYCFTSSMAANNLGFGGDARDMEFRAKSSWAFVRGHRHQVLEEEFFQFVLLPHDEALKAAYGIGAKEIAVGIQKITDSFRSGHASASAAFKAAFEKVQVLMKSEALSMDAAIEKLASGDPEFSAATVGFKTDMFDGGICNLSRKTELPNDLLADMAYDPGEETKFYEAGVLAGTPLRTLPARIRPLVRLGGDYFATDGQFVRDSSYRAIQRGLIGRNPSYREGWNKKQKELTEGAFPAVLRGQLSDATIYSEVYFKDVATGQWVETDTLGVSDDNLFVIEAKAGVMAMHSPATDFQRHIRAVQELVVKAYYQCRRFVEYLASNSEVPIFRLEAGGYSEVAKLTYSSFRKIIPIGLTVEAFTPFSAMCKELPEVQPILDKHPFISMSVDDLFVLNRFLPTTGALFHYLDVRQQVAGIPSAMMFDEMDHLGAYISRNRFDQTMREQLERADRVSWDSFSDTVNDYFHGVHWQDKPVPSQQFPAEILKMLDALDRSRPKGWLAFDSLLRDLGSEARVNLASLLRQLLPSLDQHPIRSFLFHGETALQVFLHRRDTSVPLNEITHRGEVACLICERSEIPVLAMSVGEEEGIGGANCWTVKAPSVVREDYSDLVAEAAAKRDKHIKLAENRSERPMERLSRRARRRNRHKK